MFKNLLLPTIEVAEALKDILNKAKHEIKNIGTRHGEKKYEVLAKKKCVTQRLK